MGLNLQQRLTILTRIMIILCCILQCYVFFCFFCHFATTWFFGAFFQPLWASYSLCGTRPGGKVRLNEAENQSKRGPLIHALSRDTCRSVAVNDAADRKLCCFFVFYFRWLGWFIFLTCINTCLEVMHDRFVSPVCLDMNPSWMQGTCRKTGSC